MKIAILLALSVSISIEANAQCTTAIMANTTVCAGDTSLLSAAVTGPGNSLTTTLSAGNNHRGNMFDIVATNGVTIQSFDVFPMGNTTIEIYYKSGTWDGFANTPAAWTFVGSAPVTYTGGAVAVPVAVNVSIPAGQTYAFYVTSNTSSVSLNYSNGSTVGAVFASDANITFLEGGGMEYPFTQGTGAVYQPRIWNGNIHYALTDPAGVTYSWNTTATTQTIQPTVNATTTYSVQTNLSGCPTMNDTVTITVSTPPVSGGADRILCAGDTLLLAGSGAESYAWNNGVTDSVAFTPGINMSYIVIGTDSIGCVNSDTLSVLVNALPVLMTTANVAVCTGDSLTLQATGADSYSWDQGVVNNVAFLPLVSETYTVVGTNAGGCSDTAQTVVTVNEMPVVSAGPDQAICNGSLVTLNGSGAASYSWNVGVTDGVPFMGSGAFVVTGASAEGCTDTDTVIVTTLSVNTATTINGSTIMAVATGVFYSWINCASMDPITDAVNQAFTAPQTGVYAVIVTSAATGCADTSSCVLIDFAGLDELASEAVTVFPVPAVDKVTVRAASAIDRIELTDVIGNVLLVTTPGTTETELDLSVYAASQFFVRVYSAGGTAVIKVIKK